MRNPARIPKVLAEVQRLWEKHPDLRLTQLLLNVGEYNTEDDVLLERLLAQYDR